MKIRNNPIDLDKPLKDGEFIVKKRVLAISSIIYHGMRASAHGGPFEKFALKLGDPSPSSGTMGIVIKSSSGAKFQEGDIVFGNVATTLDEYALVSKETEFNYHLRNEAKETKLPLSNYLSAVGEIGLVKYGTPKAGETLYVSAAAGNVGLYVGQIAKILGLRVIGSAGSEQKLEFLKSIGYDSVFNYKTDDASTKLKELAPDGIDIYFDNVCGRTLEIAIEHMKFYGRIAACGGESQYYAEKQDGIHNMVQVFVKCLTIRGFQVFSEPSHENQEFRVQMTKWIQEGKIKAVETDLGRIENIPEGMTKISGGEVTGKIIVNIP